MFALTRDRCSRSPSQTTGWLSTSVQFHLRSVPSVVAFTDDKHSTRDLVSKEFVERESDMEV